MVGDDAVERGQRQAAALGAVEGRGAQRGEAEGLLAEIGIVLVVEVRVLALAGGQERVDVGNLELLGQLLQGVGFLDEALLDEGLDLGGDVLLEVVGHGVVVGALAVHERGAAGGVEARHVLDPVGVPDLVPVAQALGLLADGVHHEVVRGALVVEALAGVVHAQEGLRAEEEVAVVAEVVVRVADLLVVAQQAAVEDERGVHGVHLGACPQQGLDAVALAGGEGVEAGQAGVRLVLQGLVHLLVHGVAAGGHHDARRGVDADIGAVGVGGINALAGVAVHDELNQGSLKAHVAPVEAPDVGVHGLGHLGLTIRIVAIGAVAGGPLGVTGALRHVVLELDLHAVAVEDILVPVHGLAGVLGPNLHQAGVNLAQGVVVHIVHDVDGLDEGTLLLLLAGVHRADGGAADVVALRVLLDEQRLGAVLGGGAGREVTRGAGTDDEDLALDGLDAVGVGHDGSGAQPGGDVGGRGVSGGLSGGVGRGLGCSLVGQGRGGGGGGGGHGASSGSDEGAAVHRSSAHACSPSYDGKRRGGV